MQQAVWQIIMPKRAYISGHLDLKPVGEQPGQLLFLLLNVAIFRRVLCAWCGVRFVIVVVVVFLKWKPRLLCLLLLLLHAAAVADAIYHHR
jgi:hypothetical protein